MKWSRETQEWIDDGKEIPEEEKESNKNIIENAKTNSMVKHPRHYNRDGAIECIEEMILVFGEEATANFCLLNCWKYRYRAGLKNDGYQDIEKSDWYMQKYKELKEKIANNNLNKSYFTISSDQIKTIPV